MLQKLCKHSGGVQMGVRVATAALIGFGGMVQPTLAWQFREVDTSDSSSAAQDVELEPTQEVFLAPVVDVEQLEPETAENEPLAPAQATANASDKKAPESSATSPEPVPMTDLSDLDPVPETGPSAGPGAERAPALDSAAPQASGPFGCFKFVAGKEVGGIPRQGIEFRKVRAGKTSSQELLASWGSPTQETVLDETSKSLIFHDPRFQQVDVTVHDDVVSSILVHLKEPTDVQALEEELAVTGQFPVPIPDELGNILGLAYPELGLMFSFAENDAELELVDALVVEEVSGEMFRLRAEYDFGHNYQRCVDDLKSAIELDDTDAEAYWLLGQYLDTVGKTRDAIKSVQKAIRLKPTRAVYRLTRARLYAKTNQLQEAKDEVQAVLNELELPSDVAAKAHNLLGDLLAVGATANHQEALKSHLKAIDLAAKAVNDEHFAIRRRAKQVLVDAHLSVARDIAMGNFQRQAAVIPKWLLRAAEMADEFISDDSGDELIQLHIFRETLAAYAEIQISNIDAAIAAEEAIETSREFIANAKDELYKMQVERILAETLLHAARIERSRGKHDTAIGYVNNAIALLEGTSKQWDLSSHGQYLQCQLYFVLGSLYALKDQNHQEAVAWYSKARDVVVTADTVSPLYSLRGQGEMYVSMGLSYWEIGEHDTAIQITKSGTNLMSQAVENGSLDIKAMTVPYGNLAIMHSRIGHVDESEAYTKLVAKVENLEQSGTIRR